MIDWNGPNLSDEAVVRAAVPNAYRIPSGHINTHGTIDDPTSLGSWTLADDWDSARKHPTVVAFEQANRRSEPITAEICNTCLHPEHEGQCRATAACLCIQFPSLHPTAPVDRPVQEAAGEDMSDQERVRIAMEGALTAEEYIAAFGVAPWAQEVVRNAYASFAKAHDRVVREEAAGDGFEEWWAKYAMTDRSYMTVARAAWTACAERGKR